MTGFYVICGIAIATLIDVALFGTKGIIPMIKEMKKK